MKRTIRMGVLLAVCALAIWTFASQAQVIDADSCERTCNRDHAACVDACGNGDNPVECDGQCNRDWQDCLHECH